MNVIADTESVAAVPLGVGDAVGVEKSQWYVAIVKNNTEQASAQRLEQSGYHTFVATQKTIRIWKNGRKAKVDKVLLPSMVFIRCSERQRLQIVTLPFISRFMTDKALSARNTSTKKLAIIPDNQVETLRFMLGQSDVPISFTDRPLRKGDRVKVIRGNLHGLEGEVFTDANGHSELIVRIDILGCAKVSINAINLEPIG